MHLATLEDHLNTPVGQQVRGFSVLQPALPRMALQQDAACEEAFEIAELAEDDAQSEEHVEQSGLATPRMSAETADLAQTQHVHFKVAHVSPGNMRLPAIAIASGRRVTSDDIIVSVHSAVSESGQDVTVIDKPKHIIGQHCSYFGVLSLSDQDTFSLRVHSRAWKLSTHRPSIGISSVLY